jgi:hypothetical protein
MFRGETEVFHHLSCISILQCDNIYIYVRYITLETIRVEWLPFVQMKFICIYALRRVWRYQRGNQNPYIEEQTTQWPKEKVQKDKQWSTKHIENHRPAACSRQTLWHNVFDY